MGNRSNVEKSIRLVMGCKKKQSYHRHNVRSNIILETYRCRQICVFTTIQRLDVRFAERVPSPIRRHLLITFSELFIDKRVFH